VLVADPAAAHLGSEGGEYLADGGSRVTSFERMARMYASCSRVMTLADASSTNQLEFYQYNFNATWISRDVRWNNGGWPADVICPTLKLPICPFGLLNCGVFKKLNASARNCRRLLWSALNIKLLNRDKSICLVPGPYSAFRPALPYTK